jgi:hypothetical protein
MLLRMINGADFYTDYVSPGFPIRKLTEQVPSQTGRACSRILSLNCPSITCVLHEIGTLMTLSARLILPNF